MIKEHLFLLLTNDPVELKVFNKFSELCDYVNVNELKRHNYKVFLDTLEEISEREYKYIPEETFK